MKSDLQIRAEEAVKKFDNARKPVVFEFAGVPKAGKTSTLGALQAFLKRSGFRVEVVVERASVCPVRDKKHSNFNIWTACTTLAQILEKTQNPPRPDDPHILILDRGLFDSICWLSLMEHLERIRSEEREIVEKFLKIGDWRKRISAVFVMTVKPEDAMTREQGLLPVQSSKGSIMNHEVLQQMLKTTEENVKRLKKDFRIFEIDTSGNSKDGPKRTAEKIADLALNVIEEHLREDILCLPRKKITDLFGDRRFIPLDEAQKLVHSFGKQPIFRPRDEAESDKELVQALPIVVIRNKSGDVLRLRRKERDGENPLHEKIVIWAGGHARKEDQANGETLVQCAIRELQEELRLSLDPNELQLHGAIYFNQNQKSARHVAILYEWRAPADDVAMVLSTAEFFERRGTALSGTFVSLKSLFADVENEKIDEPWSVEIVQQVLGKGQFNFSRRLL
ncbi:MAG TPA: NUDIX domain-containing protein [Verrucomicrobiae bacterium]|nr:NUDIX domain-containing protein [Verrucomicrobiae bacterium]